MGGLFFKSGVDKLQPTNKPFFGMALNDIEGNPIVFDQYKGKKAYICVNVACACGLTTSNYSELVDLYKQYGPHGLEILGFPCNQFMGQESKPEPEIKEFVIKKFGVSFPLFQKIDVNGPDTHELYRYLRLNSELRTCTNEAKQVPWNFGKFLLDSEGKVIKFYNPDIKPKAMEKDIQKLLGQ